MNKIPSILVDTGFEVDQNGALTEIDIPAVVTTLNVPTKVTFNGTSLNYIPSTTAALQELSCPKMLVVTHNQFKTYTNLQSVSMASVTAINDDEYRVQNTPTKVGAFSNLTYLVNLNMPLLTTINCSITGNYNPGTYNGTFNSCGFVNLTLESLQTITHYNSYNNATNCGVFNNCINLKTVNFPKIQRIGATTDSGAGTNCGTFGGCTSLESVTFGSEGNPVQVISPLTFTGCTQSGLTITVYTADGLPLSGSPWGATNTQPDFIQA